MNFWRAYHILQQERAVSRTATILGDTRERILFLCDEFIVAYNPEFYMLGIAGMWQQDLDATDWQVTNHDVKLLRLKFEAEKLRY